MQLGKAREAVAPQTAFLPQTNLFDNLKKYHLQQMYPKNVKWCKYQNIFCSLNLQHCFIPRSQNGGTAHYCDG